MEATAKARICSGLLSCALVLPFGAVGQAERQERERLEAVRVALRSATKVLVGKISSSGRTIENAADGSPLASLWNFEPLFTVDTEKVVKSLVDSLCLAAPSGDDGPSFSGSLSRQLFLSDANQVIAAVLVINDRSHLVVGPGSSFQVAGRSFIYRQNERPGVVVTNCRTFRSEQYCRQVYGLMLERSPGEIERQRSGYLRVGTTLESALFGTGRVPHAIPRRPGHGAGPE